MKKQVIAISVAAITALSLMPVFRRSTMKVPTF